MLPNPNKRKRTPAAAEPPEPYPEHRYPTREQCLAVRDDLLSFHGFPEEFERYRRSPSDHGSPTTPGVLGETILDGLIITILSQNTTESNSQRAFKSLKSVFPTWAKVVDAESKLVEESIRCGGLAVIKAARIKSILKTVREKRGDICLEYLRGMPIAEVKAELSQFKGVGPKTVACVLMFHLQQDDFPVDIHVLEIAKSIGWLPLKANREKAYLHLNRRIPNELKFDLNCLLFTHGKLCKKCTKRGGSQKSSVLPTTCPLVSHFCLSA